MKYVIVTLVCSLIAIVIAPFALQFASWAAGWFKGLYTTIEKGPSQEVSEDPTEVTQDEL